MRLPFAALMLVGCALDAEGYGNASSEAVGGAATTVSGSGAEAGGTAATSSGGSGKGGDGTGGEGTGGQGGSGAPCGGGATCVASAPSGWEGYYHLHRAPYPDSAPPMCPDGGAPALWTDAPADSAQCAACACGNVTGAQCHYQVTFWSSTNCTGNVADTFDHASAYSCVSWNPPNTLSAKIGPTIVDGGSCSASGGAFLNPTPWGFADAICGVALGAGLCPPAQACVGLGSADYSSVCVRRPGSHACPSEFPQAIEAYAGFTDTRGCSACSCGAPQVQCSGGEVVAHETSQCSGSSAVLDTSRKDLSSFTNNNTISDEGGTITESGTCAFGGGVPVGSLVPAGLTTYCCM